MAPRITIIGGGSNQWVPTLVTDIAHKRSLQEAEIVLEDIDAARLERTSAYVEHIARVLGIPLQVRATTDQRDALEGAEYVIVNISTGGFTSMRQDLEIPIRYGIHQTVGDTVGPGGVVRGLRNIPILVGIARDMEDLCPDAWLLNLTNPMTTLCRAVTRETSINTVGLCHEVTITQFYLAQLLDAPFFEIRPTITGVNHLPIITACDVGGEDGLARLHDLLEDGDLDQPLQYPLPDGLGHEPLAEGEAWTKAKLLDVNRLKIELFRRTGALPGAGDRHLAEFFAGFLTDASDHGKRWGVHYTDISHREAWESRYAAQLDARLASHTVPNEPSGEMVHVVIDALMRDRPVELPLNIPNEGQCPDLPLDSVVESMCVVDGKGIRGRDVASAPPLLAEQLRRVVASQELVVTAALSGQQDDVVAAMVADPLAGRLDWDLLHEMTAEMLAATRAWLPQFA